eukprot:2639012-Amphidinium_carterae.1
MRKTASLQLLLVVFSKVKSTVRSTPSENMFKHVGSYKLALLEAPNSMTALQAHGLTPALINFNHALAPVSFKGLSARARYMFSTTTTRS